MKLFVFVATLLLAITNHSARAQDPSIESFLRSSGPRYQEARKDGLTVSTQALRERLAGGRPILVLDARSPARAAAEPIEGARRVPLSEILSAGGLVNLPRDGPVAVVGDDTSAAVEAMVFLRLAGVPALAVTDGSALTSLPVKTNAETPPSARIPSTPTARIVDADLQATPWALPATAVLGAALMGVLGYYLFWIPRKRRAKVDQALGIIARDEKVRFDEAAQLLGDALLSGLRLKDVNEARFALAYVRVRLGDLPEAAAVVADLVRNGSVGCDILYIDLWLKAKLKKYDDAACRYEESQGELAQYLDSDRLASIAFLQKGRACLARREMEQALHYFDRVRKLEVLRAHLPSDLGEHQVVLGVQALYEKDWEQARKIFESARAATPDRNQAALHAELGLLLCDWTASDCPDVDEPLGHLVERLEAGVPPSERVQAEGTAQETGLTDARRLLRNVGLWYAVSLLHVWRRLPTGEPLSGEHRQQLAARLGRVRKLDPAMCDPDLIEGLIDYYFFADDAASRQQAVETLDRALRREVNVPEVRVLADRERKLQEATRKSVETFLTLVRGYLADRTVPIELRHQLRERMERFSRFKSAGDSIQVLGEESAPSVSDLHSRSLLAHRRIQTLLQTGEMPSGDKQEIQRMLTTLKDTAILINKQAQGLQRTEQALMATAGELLLREEEPMPPPSNRGNRK